MAESCRVIGAYPVQERAAQAVAALILRYFARHLRAG